MNDIDYIIEKALKGDKFSISRLISLIEREDEHAPKILEAIYPHSGNAFYLGITGSPGAGKSTLVDLLFRFHDPQDGSISVDGTPLPDFDLTSWRSRLALMSQVTDERNAILAGIRGERIAALEAVTAERMAVMAEIDELSRRLTDDGRTVAMAAVDHFFLRTVQLLIVVTVLAAVVGFVLQRRRRA